MALVVDIQLCLPFTGSDNSYVPCMGPRDANKSFFSVTRMIGHWTGEDVVVLVVVVVEPMSVEVDFVVVDWAVVVI